MGAEKLIEARLLAHHGAQWLARFARSYLPPVPDDSHTALTWDEKQKAFLSAVGSGGGFGFDVETLTVFAAAPGGGRGPGLALAGKTDFQAEGEFKNILKGAGFDPEKLKVALPYEIPPHAIAAGAAYNAAPVRGELKTLSALFDEASRLLSAVKARDPNASRVRTWPHHFDMATLMAIAGKPHSSVNAGFSPGDDHYAEPYYYISPYPYPKPEALPKNPAFHWHTENFTAAIIPFAKWPKAGREAFLAKGLADAVAGSKALLA